MANWLLHSPCTGCQRCHYDHNRKWSGNGCGNVYWCKFAWHNPNILQYCPGIYSTAPHLLSSKKFNSMDEDWKIRNLSRYFLIKIEKKYLLNGRYVHFDEMWQFIDASKVFLQIYQKVRNRDLSPDLQIWLTSCRTVHIPTHRFSQLILFWLSLLYYISRSFLTADEPF